MSSVVTAYDEQQMYIDLEKVAEALGPATKLAFSPPHDYPMSAPRFRTTPNAARERPESEHLRLYVHIPFCNYACTFCFFSKQIGASLETKKRYVKALEAELEWIVPGTPLSQLFIGGGTPTCLPPELMDQVLHAIFDRVSQEGAGVHTVEASPESLTQEHLDVLKKHGIGRISMGVQSLDQETLDSVNRRHEISQSLRAMDLINENGFILNIDMMYGLPNQGFQSFRRDLEVLMKKDVPSVTLYDLRINENTPIARKINGEQRWDLEGLISWRSFVRKTAIKSGLTQTRWHTYKNMNSIAARHERIKCFKSDGMGYQLGIGMSARSQLGYTVYRNYRNINKYMESVENGYSPVEELIPLSLEDRKTQFVARSLGDGSPLVRREYIDAFSSGIDDDFGEAVARLCDNGIVDDHGDSLLLTDTGKLVYDLMLVNFYPEDALEWVRNNSGRKNRVNAG